MEQPREFVYCDFEYRDDGREVILGCFLHLPSNERVTIDCRDPVAGRQLLEKLRARWNEPIWLSFSAGAEMGCMARLGVDYRGLDWICLFAESRQITGTHAHFYSRKGGLLKSLEAFGITSRGNVALKEATRDLILSRPDYTVEEWASIVDYCWSDIEPLPELWLSIQKVHALREKPYKLKTAIFRADYLKASVHLERRSRGLPIDEALCNRIYGNVKAVRRALAERCNATYGGPIFRYNKARDEFSFHFAGLVDHVSRLPFPVDWDVTTCGRLRTDADYLDEFTRDNPYFKPLATTMFTLSQLKTSDLRAQLRDGFVHPTSLPFYTITGRNQPLAARGFVLNMPSWLRYLVRPKPGEVLISADWSQQEIVIAAILSGDPALKEALASGDVYLALAKMAGAVPADATKASHPAERQSYKSAQLGIGYGMGAATLGKRLYLDLAGTPGAISMEEADERASAILAWHKRTFEDYWHFVRREVNVAQDRGWIWARDGWTFFADRNSRFTQLQNFPMQSNAAVILREAIKNLAEFDQIEFACSLHDAVYINAPAAEADRHEAILRDCMSRATLAVVGGAIPIRIDTTVYTAEAGYSDPRGLETYNYILGILDEIERKEQYIPPAA